MIISDLLYGTGSSLGAEIIHAAYDTVHLQIGPANFAQLAFNLQDSVLSSEIIGVIRIVALIVSVLLVVYAFYLRSKFFELNQKLTAAAQTQQTEPSVGGPLQSRWEEIMRHVESVREGEWKYAVIEADKLVDDELKKHFPGETMGERLMNIDKTKLLTIDGLWEAHKVRNRLAHDTNYFLRHAEAVRAIRLLEQTLKELEALS